MGCHTWSAHKANYTKDEIVNVVKNNIKTHLEFCIKLKDDYEKKKADKSVINDLKDEIKLMKSLKEPYSDNIICEFFNEGSSNGISVYNNGIVYTRGKVCDFFRYTDCDDETILRSYEEFLTFIKDNPKVYRCDEESHKLVKEFFDNNPESILFFG